MVLLQPVLNIPLRNAHGVMSIMVLLSMEVCAMVASGIRRKRTPAPKNAQVAMSSLAVMNMAECAMVVL